MLWCGSSQYLCGARGIPWLCAAGNRMDSGSKTQHGLESERPQEIAKEAETELEDAQRLETEQK